VDPSSFQGDQPQRFEDLIVAARAGSQKALGELLAVCQPFLLLLARTEMKSDLQAKLGASDVVQETFLEAQRDFAGFRGRTRAELLAWLRHILVHNMANLVRRYRTTEKRQVTREVSLGGGDSHGKPEQELPASGLSPGSQAVTHEQALMLERALERLPEHYRAVILSRHHDGLSFAEIGQSMNRSAEAVRKLWARAIERLQLELIRISP
jgi:RNA polymerase sigma-70 factor (ECF subfamily)